MPLMKDQESEVNSSTLGSESLQDRDDKLHANSAASVNRSIP